MSHDPCSHAFFWVGEMADLTRADRLAIDRDRLESAIGEASPSALPALVREHRAILAELDALAAPKKGSTRDQLAERRASRKSKPSGSSASEV